MDLVRCHELRARLLFADKSLASVARDAGCTRAMVSQVLAGRRRPTPTVVAALATAAGWEESRVVESLTAGRLPSAKAAIEQGRAAVKAIGLDWPVDRAVDPVEAKPVDYLEMAALRAVLTALIEANEP